MNVQTSGLALRSQTVNTSIRNLVLIVAGQSNVTNVAPSVYTPSNPSKIDCLNVYDGGIYEAKDPLLGCDLNPTLGPGNPALRLADKLITANKFDRVVLVPLAIDASDLAFWLGDYANNRIPTAIGRLAAKGFTTQTNVTIAVLWGHGESDNLAGTTQANYVAGLTSIIASSRTAGFTGPWFVPRQTYISGGTSATIRAAQAAIISSGAGIYAGPDADTLIGTACSGVACRQADLTHWSDAGSDSYAAAWQTALAAYGAPF